MRIKVATDGEIQALYTEQLDLNEIGMLSLKRASHVEPSKFYEGKWVVDLSPVDGPLAGPFAKRSEALAWEVKWIEENVL